METVDGQIQGDRWTVAAGHTGFSMQWTLCPPESLGEGEFTSELNIRLRLASIHSEIISLSNVMFMCTGSQKQAAGYYICTFRGKTHIHINQHGIHERATAERNALLLFLLTIFKAEMSLIGN